MNNFPVFKRLGIHEKTFVEGYVSKYPPYSDFNFASIYSYNVNNDWEYTLHNDNLVIKLRDYITNKPFYTFMGSNNVVDTISDLLLLAESEGIDPELKLVPEHSINDIFQTLQKKFELIEDPDSFDYILSTDNLINLKGRDHHTKRTSVNRFQRLYPDHTVRIIDLHDTNIRDEIIRLFKTWEALRNREIEDTETEFKATLRLMDASDKFNLVSLGIFHGDRMIGYSINEVVHDGYYMAHFGKIDSKYNSIFQYLEHVTAIEMKKYGCDFMNYEQDLGIPGLKASKQTWNPIGYFKKYKIRWKKLGFFAKIIKALKSS